MKLLTDLFTEDDGTSWCLSRVSFGVSLFSFLLVAFYQAVGAQISLIAFAGGLATILTAGGTAIALKARTQILRKDEERQ